MRPVFALDIYGTLIDPLAISQVLAHMVGQEAQSVAELWRTKQLEYSFRRGLMGVYRNFSEVTAQALDYALTSHGLVVDREDRQDLLEHYRALDAFPDAKPALTALRDLGASLHAFSNGVASDVTQLLAHAGLNDLIGEVVSADEIATFKPDPKLYSHFAKRVGAETNNMWLVSSNPFDVIGATACGWQSAWVQRRDTTVFDPWEFKPTRIIKSLGELSSIVEAN